MREYMSNWKSATKVQQKKVAELKFKGFQVFDTTHNATVLNRGNKFRTVYVDGRIDNGIPV